MQKRKGHFGVFLRIKDQHFSLAKDPTGSLAVLGFELMYVFLTFMYVTYIHLADGSMLFIYY